MSHLLTCARCGKDAIFLFESPHPQDKRRYCPDCYTYLFPPGWTDEIELADPEDSTLVFPPSDEDELP